MRLAGATLAAIVICLIGWTLRPAGGESEQHLSASKAFIARADQYAAHREYFNWLVATAHNDVFSKSIGAGAGRRARSKMSVEKYRSDITHRMLELARMGDRQDVADSIARLISSDAEARQKTVDEDADQKGER